MPYINGIEYIEGDASSIRRLADTLVNNGHDVEMHYDPESHRWRFNGRFIPTAIAEVIRGRRIAQNRRYEHYFSGDRHRGCESGMSIAMCGNPACANGCQGLLNEPPIEIPELELVRCGYCERRVPTSDAQQWDVPEMNSRDLNRHYIRCSNCTPLQTSPCVCCGDIYRTTAMHETYNESTEEYERICFPCLNEQGAYCHECSGIITHQTEAIHTDSGWMHLSCHNRIAMRDLIKRYGYKPTPIFSNGASEKVTNRTLYLGVEIELASDDPPRQDRVLIDINKNYPMTYMKEDSSITNEHGQRRGVEFVSHPMTMAHILENNALGFVDDLPPRWYNDDSCGMHVHMSRSAFTTWHLYKLMTFIYSNNQFVFDVSGRTYDSADSWGNPFVTYSPRRKVAMAKKRRGQRDRSEVLNFEPDATVECRVFASPDSTSNAVAKVMLLDALYRFSKECTKESLQSYKPFVAYVAKSKEYKTLTNYLASRGYNG